MSRSEYIRIHSKYFPLDIRDRYEIEGLIAADRYIYIKIIKGMYGLKEAAIIAYNQLISQMEPYGYYLVPFTTGPDFLAYVWMILEYNIFLKMIQITSQIP